MAALPTVQLRNQHDPYGLRLKLSGIERKGPDNICDNICDNIWQPYYSFEYNSMNLPYRFSLAKDYYGYYNGKTTVP